MQRGRGDTTLSTLGIGASAEGWVLGALARAGGGIYQHVLLGERMNEERKNRLSEMAELFTRGVSSAPPSLDDDLRTRVTGLEMLERSPSA